MATRTKRAPKVSDNGVSTIDVELDMEQLTWDDMVLIENWQQSSGDTSLSDIKAMFDRVVIGGVGHLPFVSSMGQIMTAISEAMEQQTDAKN